MPHPMPVNEADRLAALARYEILDTPPEFAHDALTELAAEIRNCPVALISLIDERRQWFKSKYGLPADFAECPREMTVCTTTICSNDLLYVPDLPRDPCPTTASGTRAGSAEPAAASLRPPHPFSRTTAVTVSKIRSMSSRVAIRGGENSKVSAAIRTMRPRS